MTCSQASQFDLKLATYRLIGLLTETSDAPEKSSADLVHR